MQRLHAVLQNLHYSQLLATERQDTFIIISGSNAIQKIWHGNCYTLFNNQCPCPIKTLETSGSRLQEHVREEKTCPFSAMTQKRTRPHATNCWKPLCSYLAVAAFTASPYVILQKQQMLTARWFPTTLEARNYCMKPFYRNNSKTSKKWPARFLVRKEIFEKTSLPHLVPSQIFILPTRTG